MTALRSGQRGHDRCAGWQVLVGAKSCLLPPDRVHPWYLFYPAPDSLLRNVSGDVFPEVYLLFLPCSVRFIAALWLVSCSNRRQEHFWGEFQT